MENLMNDNISLDDDIERLRKLEQISSTSERKAYEKYLKEGRKTSHIKHKLENLYAEKIRLFILDNIQDGLMDEKKLDELANIYTVMSNIKNGYNNMNPSMKCIDNNLNIDTLNQRLTIQRAKVKAIKHLNVEYLFDNMLSPNFLKMVMDSSDVVLRDKLVIDKTKTFEQEYGLTLEEFKKFCKLDYSIYCISIKDLDMSEKSELYAKLRPALHEYNERRTKLLTPNKKDKAYTYAKNYVNDIKSLSRELKYAYMIQNGKLIDEAKEKLSDKLDNLATRDYKLIGEAKVYLDESKPKKK